MPKTDKNFRCEICDLTCRKQSELTLHTMRPKHIKMMKLGQKDIKNMPDTPENNEITHKCPCGKKYKHYSGLWRHSNVCKKNINTIVEQNKILVEETINLKKIMFDQNIELKNLILEVCKKNNTITNNNNSHNKTFNLQFFLNEQCKDAMNLMDFVKSVNLQLSDLENVKNLGYVDGITGIIVKKLNEMDVHKRPIHCSDAKREIMHIREDDIWSKEDEEHTHLRKAIKGISKKNRLLLSEWSESHPDSNDIHSPMNLEYMLMIVQAMGGKGELVDNENKIMKKIMKSVLIEK